MALATVRWCSTNLELLLIASTPAYSAVQGALVAIAKLTDHLCETSVAVQAEHDNSRPRARKKRANPPVCSQKAPPLPEYSAAVLQTQQSWANLPLCDDSKQQLDSKIHAYMQQQRMNLKPTHLVQRCPHAATAHGKGSAPEDQEVAPLRAPAAAVFAFLATWQPWQSLEGQQQTFEHLSDVLPLLSPVLGTSLLNRSSQQLPHNPPGASKQRWGDLPVHHDLNSEDGYALTEGTHHVQSTVASGAAQQAVTENICPRPKAAPETPKCACHVLLSHV
jgi:hypothetical protein